MKYGTLDVLNETAAVHANVKMTVSMLNQMLKERHPWGELSVYFSSTVLCPPGTGRKLGGNQTSVVGGARQ